MSNNTQATVLVTACDNELFIIAASTSNSYLLANIKSGNSHTVNYELKISEGPFDGSTQNVNGVSNNIPDSGTTPQVGYVSIPALENNEEYSFIVLGADWGGSQAGFNVCLKQGSTTVKAYDTGTITTPQGDASEYAPAPGAFASPTGSYSPKFKIVKQP